MKAKMPLPSGRANKARKKEPIKGNGVYRLRVELAGSDPPIWRRLQVPGEITLSSLHRVLQAAMGWENCHLHEFKIGKVSYGSAAESDDPFAIGLISDKGTCLKNVLTPRTKEFAYIYDFGDDWVHRITVEGFSAPESGPSGVRCLGGERACPPEDCGGIYGYYGYLEILKDPKHPEYEELKEWIGRHDPERFDIDRVNMRLKRLPKIMSPY